MKKLFSATAIALALSAGAALAADLPAIKAPPPPPLPPPPLWTGFYAGLNAGYSWGATNTIDVATVNVFDSFGPAGFLAPIVIDPRAGSAALAASGTANAQRNGFIGGGQVGYNYQFGNSFLVGLEVDLQGAGIRSENSFIGASSWNAFDIGPGLIRFDRAAASATTVTSRTDWLGTVRGRLGYIWGQSFLLYATGGLAYGGTQATTQQSLFLNNTLSILPPLLSISVPFGSIGGFARYNESRIGWTVGGGLEWLFAPNLSLKAEYLYYDLGTARYLNGPLAAVGPQISVLGFTTPLLTSVNQGVTRVKFDGHVARIGINYHFFTAPPPAPVVARY
ncbi:outer membrane protein [Methylosinus sp. Ce-a6]|uniref:outer membrane protein n=1 Tax=Methylosinus sp. Ce-a6 TaxID=2172005 RepID=UPI00135BDC05|nr:outer membrane beta-barrel protein [Methylosinus sp. Ce-a6]